MGDNHQPTTWQEIVQGLTKGLVWLGYISIGVMAKLAFDSRKAQLTKKQIVVKSILSIFTGYLAAVLCEQYGYIQWAKVIVPVSTLLGEGIVMYIMTNWKKWANKIIPPIFQFGKEVKKDNE